jgi:uncharacterized protein
MPLPDARSPLVLDTRELGRRPGSMRTVQREAPAPAGFGLELIRVPEGAPIELDLRLEAVMEGVLVSGSARAAVVGECARCLEPVSSSVEASLCELYAYPGHESDDDDIGRLEGDLINLEPALRDAILLALPLAPVCDEDCGGLCPGCGARLAELPDDHTHETVDPRWDALRLVAVESEKTER